MFLVSEKEFVKDLIDTNQEVMKIEEESERANNTCEFTAMLLDCNRHSLVSGDRQIKVVLVVTGGEIENEIVNMFCSKIKADENVKVQIVRDD